MAESMSYPPDAMRFGGIDGLSETGQKLDDMLETVGDAANDMVDAVVDDALEAVETVEQQASRLRRWWQAAKRSGQMAVSLAMLSPANEVIRGGATAAAYASTHSPVATALTAGVSTLVLEGAGGLASAEVFASEKAGELFKRISGKLKRADVSHLSPVTKVATTFMLGSSVGMAMEQIENPSRTREQNRTYTYRTAAWLAGSVAVGGALAAEGVNVAIDKPQVAAPIAAGVALLEAGRRTWNRLAYPRRVKHPESATWHDRDQYADYRLITDQEELVDAAVLEQEVWDEKGFGKLDEEGYADYITHSRTFGAFDREGNCIGVNRMFGATENILPPFLSMHFGDVKQQAELAQAALDGKLEELGTVAIERGYRSKGLNLHLWRLAMRDAVSRGVEQWGIIMEPERVARMNKHLGFTFQQVGPAVEYQGGDCAPFVADLGECLRSIRKQSFLKHYWFTRKGLKG